MRLRETVKADCHRFAELSGRRGGRVGLFTMLNPRVLPVVLIRLSTKLQTSGFARIANLVSLFNMLMFRVEAPARAVIGDGLVLPHPGGVVLGSASIGEDVIIYQNVTLGARSFDPGYTLSRRPTIGSRVVLGSGAVVLGPVTVGDGATVAANSLVLSDVPPGCTVIGVPAQVARHDGNNTA